MKNISIICLLLACMGLQSCKDEQNKKVTAEDNKPESTTCYRSFYEKDSISLNMNTLKDGQISGNMEMKFFNMSKKTGNIAGEFRGDTLFVDYTFTEETNSAKTLKNPMAFLKRGDELILGNGKIETYLGKSYFAKDTPIDFNRVKYKFQIVDCVAE